MKTATDENFIDHFNEIDFNDVRILGVKNASMGEIFQNLTSKSV